MVVEKGGAMPALTKDFVEVCALGHDDPVTVVSLLDDVVLNSGYMKNSKTVALNQQNHGLSPVCAICPSGAKSRDSTSLTERDRFWGSLDSKALEGTGKVSNQALHSVEKTDKTHKSKVCRTGYRRIMMGRGRSPLYPWRVTGDKRC